MQGITRTDLPKLTVRRGLPVLAIARALGRVLIVVGLLVGGFVVHQLFITSWAAERAQSGLDERFEAQAAAVEVAEVPYVPVPRIEAPIATALPRPSLDPTAAAVTVLPGEDLLGDPGAPPVLVTEPVPGEGDPVGRISIPSAGVEWTFVEGVTRAALRSGAGHMPGTALPGQPGNAVISGHRTTYGAPFANLDAVAPGDRISIETATGVHVYEAVETLVVRPEDVWVTEQWDGGWLTLTTCNPRFSSRERLVVVSRLVEGPNAAVILGDR